MRDLRVGFGDKLVMDGLDLDLYRGEVLGFVGASGAGKSVLTRTILGLLPKRSGTIEVYGRDIDAMSPRERAHVGERWGVLFQQGALFSSLTVRQNIQAPIREHLRLSSRLLDELALQKLALVGLPEDAAEKLPSELSGGMVKRAALARALALDPDLVFLDEPTSGLDPISAGDFDELIATLQKTLGLTVFMVTHDLDSLYAICDRVAALGHGKVTAVGPIQDLLKSDDPWLKAYFHGKRGRGNSTAERRRLRSGRRPRWSERPGEALVEQLWAGRRKIWRRGRISVLIGAFTLAVIAGAFLFVMWFAAPGETEPAYDLSRGVHGIRLRSVERRLGSVQWLESGRSTSIDFDKTDPRRRHNRRRRPRADQEGHPGSARSARPHGRRGDRPHRRFARRAAAGRREWRASDDRCRTLRNCRPCWKACRRFRSAGDVYREGQQDPDRQRPGDHSTLANIATFSKALGENSSGINVALKGLADLGPKIGPLATNW